MDEVGEVGEVDPQEEVPKLRFMFVQQDKIPFSSRFDFRALGRSYPSFHYPIPFSKLEQ